MTRRRVIRYGLIPAVIGVMLAALIGGGVYLSVRANCTAINEDRALTRAVWEKVLVLTPVPPDGTQQRRDRQDFETFIYERTKARDC